MAKPTTTIKAALASVNGAPADIEANTREMLRMMRQAEDAGAQLLVFPRFSILGATAGDLARSTVRFGVYRAVKQLAEASGKCLVAFSFLLGYRDYFYPAVALAHGGRLHYLLLPEGARDPEQHTHFRPRSTHFLELVRLDHPFRLERERPIALPGTQIKFAATLDRSADNARRLCSRGAVMLAHMAADPACALWHPSRLVQRQSLEWDCTLLYANAGGCESTTDSAWGGELAVASKGRLLGMSPVFSPDGWLTAEIDLFLPPSTEKLPPLPGRDSKMPYAPLRGPLRAQWCEEALEIPAQALARRMQRIGVKKVVVGLSGGLDSALALLTGARALYLLGLPRENLLAWSLPCFGTSGRTRQNALDLMDAMGIARREIDLTDSVSRHLKDIGHDGRHDAAYENAQARERTQVLMDLSNMHGGLMLGPGDLSELALGFTTYGGDHMSMYAVNAGLLKTAIRLLLKHTAATADNPALRRVLQAILRTPISPELLPGGQAAQQTEQLLGSYLVNDHILWLFLSGWRAEVMLKRLHRVHGKAYTRMELLALMERFIRRFFAAQFKRSCMPDGPRVLEIDLSPRGGFSMPSDAAPGAWLHEIRLLMQKEEQSQ
ncbi:MAG: NAD(+) synthase [Clostridiales bacterium]|nr:NAD(+) synthase [Clostridiales bacterium]